jgi:hypothetical protein
VLGVLELGLGLLESTQPPHLHALVLQGSADAIAQFEVVFDQEDLHDRH